MKHSVFLLMGLSFCLNACAGAGLSALKKAAEDSETKAAATDLGELSSPTEGQTSSDDIAETRLVQFSAASEDYIPVTRVVLVIDNSNSMQDEQALLAEGIRKMLKELKGKKVNIDFDIYTTTSRTGGEPRDKLPNLRVGALRLKLDGTVSEEPLLSNYLTKVEWSLADPIEASGLRGEAMDLQLRFNGSEEEYEKLSEELPRIIEGIGIKGSDREEGLCAMARILSEKAPSQKRDYDTAAFILISDSDDVTDLNNCIKEVQRRATPDEGFRSTLIPFSNQGEAYGIQYRMRFRTKEKDRIVSQYRYQYLTPNIVDGQDRGSRTQTVTRSLSVEDFGEDIPLTTSTYIRCDEIDGLRDYVRAEAGREIVSCSYRHFEHYSYRTDYMEVQEGVEKDYCKSKFNESLNIVDYMMSTNEAFERFENYECIKFRKRIYEKVVNLKDALRPESASLQEAIIQTAKTKYPGGFFMSAIIAAEPEVFESNVCESKEAESFGQKYVELIQGLEAQGHLHPICDTRYYEALRSIEAFIESTTVNRYELQLEEGERVDCVRRAGSEQEAFVDLVEGEHYLIKGSTIEFAEGVIHSSDLLQVELVR